MLELKSQGGASSHGASSDEEGLGRLVSVRCGAVGGGDSGRSDLDFPEPTLPAEDTGPSR